MRFFSIKNFERHQHYKDRRPPWIKLHVSLLDDYEFIQLKDVAKAHLMLLWALASQTDNKIPYDAKWVTQRIGARERVDLDGLAATGFLVPWSEENARGKLEEWPSRHVSAQVRAQLFEAAEHKCKVCGSSEHLEIDHIVPISQGGTSSPENLQVLCRTCNRRKRAKLSRSAEQPRSDLLRSDSAPDASRDRGIGTEAEPESETEKSDDVRGQVRKALPAKYRKDFDSLLGVALSRPAERESWLRSLHAVLFDGYEFPSRDPELLGQGLREMLGTPGAPTWRKYAGFVRPLLEPAAPQNSGKKGPTQSQNGIEPAVKLAAAQQLEEIQKLKVGSQTLHGMKYHVPLSELEALPPAVKSAIAALGGSLTSGAQRIIDCPSDKYSILLGQFQTLYAGAIQTERARIGAHA